MEALPNYIFWELTYKCNEKCVMCPIHGNYGTKSLNEPELSTYNIVNSLKDIKDCYINKGLSLPRIKLTGGEIFLKKDLFEILDKISNLGFQFGLMSNFTLTNENVMNKLLHYTPKFVNVSLDGSELVHDLIRNTKDAYKKTFNNFKNYVKKSREAGQNISFEINCVISDYNINHLEDLIAISKNIGVPLTYQHLSFLTPELLEEQLNMDEAVFTKKYHHLTTLKGINSESIKLLANKIIILKDLASKNNVDLNFKPNITSEKEIIDYYTFNHLLSVCDFVTSGIRISPSGGVSPCMDYEIDNIMNNSFETIIFSETMKKFKEKLLNESLPICYTCCKITPIKRNLE